MADGDLQVVPDQTGGRLGRHLWHDPGNRAYAARGVLFAEDAALRSRTWYRRLPFDQGEESSCTAQAAAGVLISSPNRVKLARTNLALYDEAKERNALYRAAQAVDPWAGTPHEGSSTDAPFKVLRTLGLISEWRWCFGIEDVLRTIGHWGPVAIGTDWHAGMDNPNSHGFVLATGGARGGHAYELVGVHLAGFRPSDVTQDGTSFVTAVNSWGPGWGDGGRFRMSLRTLDQLLEANGDAATIVLP